MSRAFDRFWSRTRTRSEVKLLVDDLLALDTIPDDLLDRSTWEAGHDRGGRDPYLGGLLDFERAFLRVVRDLRDISNRRAENAARFWSILAHSREGLFAPQVGHFRCWHPPTTASTVDARSICREMGRLMAAGGNYSLPFPVVNSLKNRDWTQAIVHCQVTVFPNPGSAPDSGALSPCVFLSPWSELIPDESSFHGIEAMFERYRGLFENQIHLLDFRPMESYDPFEGSLISGDSLGLAIFIAALAANQKHASLRPVVATGRIVFEGESPVRGVGKIKSIEGFPEKLKAVERFANDRGEDVIFLVAKGSRQTQSGCNRVKVEDAPHLLDDLIELVQTKLSDDCTRYKAHLANGAPSSDPEENARTPPPDTKRDRTRLDAFARKALECETIGQSRKGHPCMLLPFGSEPIAVAREVARQSIEGSRANPGATCIPLLLPLKLVSEIVPASPHYQKDRLLHHLIQGISDLDRKDLLSEDALNNLIIRSPGRILFVAYGAPSLDLGYEKDLDPLKSLFEELRHRTKEARLVVIASDIHHALWLSSKGVVSRALIASGSDAGK